jgi:hypothetical protein
MAERREKKTGKNYQVNQRSLRSKVRCPALSLASYVLTTTQGAPTNLHETIQGQISNPGPYWTRPLATVRRYSTRGGRYRFLTHPDKATSKEPQKDSGATLMGSGLPNIATVRPPLRVSLRRKGKEGAPHPNVVTIQSHSPNVCAECLPKSTGQIVSAPKGHTVEGEAGTGLVQVDTAPDADGATVSNILSEHGFTSHVLHSWRWTSIFLPKNRAARLVKVLYLTWLLHCRWTCRLRRRLCKTRLTYLNGPLHRHRAMRRNRRQKSEISG